MGRVGCMPCVNVRKSELATIAARYPEELERVAQWERLVSMASKRGSSTLTLAYSDPKSGGDARISHRTHGRWIAVEWERTNRGGRQFDLLFETMDHAVYHSVYELCT